MTPDRPTTKSTIKPTIKPTKKTADDGYRPVSSEHSVKTRRITREQMRALLAEAAPAQESEPQQRKVTEQSDSLPVPDQPFSFDGPDTEADAEANAEFIQEPEELDAVRDIMPVEEMTDVVTEGVTEGDVDTAPLKPHADEAAVLKQANRNPHAFAKVVRRELQRLGLTQAQASVKLGLPNRGVFNNKLNAVRRWVAQDIAGLVALTGLRVRDMNALLEKEVWKEH